MSVQQKLYGQCKTNSSTFDKKSTKPDEGAQSNNSKSAKSINDANEYASSASANLLKKIITRNHSR